ncbi:putative membrane protein YesL [Metabacillus crassostreae]|uniref:hypothetical protein n=1 Tax=Metabacillus crassostreae TaxID=929098 RepID=UPI00195B18E0|nr:hypothetical protein [Metabacillus crassostreae]MBM7603976.1 putative membrane protein YesL [Metabacillus crassostreae]
MNSKIMMFFQFMYKYFLTSFYFWLNLVKGLFVYSLIPAICALYLVLRDINSGADDEQNITVKELYNIYFARYKNYKFVSFSFMISLILCYTCLYFLNKVVGEVFLLPIILVIYLLLMTLLILIYFTVYITFKGMDTKNGMIHGFLSVFKYPVNTIAIIVIIVFLYLSIGLNFAFFVAFGPFLMGLGILLSLYKLIQH